MVDPQSTPEPDWRDLVRRLREDSSTDYGCQNCDGLQREEVADEIERLRAYLDDIKGGGPTVDAVLREEWALVAEWMSQRAEDALAGKPFTPCYALREWKNANA